MRFYKNAKALSFNNSFQALVLLILITICPFAAGAQPFAYVASVAGSTVTVVNVANHSIVAAPYIPGGMTGVAAAPNSPW